MTALDQAWAEWMQPKGPTGKRSQGENWRIGNKDGEWPLLLAYRNGGPRPTLATRTGIQMVFETDAWLAEQPVPPPPPPGNVTHKFLFDARVDAGKPFGSIFDLVQISDGSYQTQGKSHMVDAAWAKRNGRDVIRLSSPGFPSGISPVPGGKTPWYERAQMGDNRQFAVGEKVCYVVGFFVPPGMDVYGNDLMFEAPHVQVGNYGPPQFLYLKPGVVEYRLQTGRVRTSGGPVWECSYSTAWGKSVGTQYAIPVDRMSFTEFHLVAIESMLTPDLTGWVNVHHKSESLDWKQTVSLTGVPTIQCLDDAQRTVPSLNCADLFNLYVLAKRGLKERDFDLLGRWDSFAEAKAELGT